MQSGKSTANLIRGYVRRFVSSGEGNENDNFLGTTATMSELTMSELYRNATEAHQQWYAELKRLFGSEVESVRYTQQSEGNPGSKLRVLYDRFRWTRDQLLRAMEHRTALEFEEARKILYGE